VGVGDDRIEGPTVTEHALATCRALRRVYGSGASAVTALDGVDLDLMPGEVVALTGPSGSGKSSLLHLLGAMDVPTSGSVVVAGADLSKLDDDAASRFRNEHLGFVFQFFHLIPSLSVMDNVALPARLGGLSTHEAEERAAALVERVGLAAQARRLPDALSGGQQQRVAIARALVNEPELVLADEPTGNLDHSAGAEIMQLLLELADERRIAALVATHDPQVRAFSRREVALEDGRLATAVL
jgi:putative ABC transport system ATP-binding protein